MNVYPDQPVRLARLALPEAPPAQLDQLDLPARQARQVLTAKWVRPDQPALPEATASLGPLALQAQPGRLDPPALRAQPEPA